MNHCADNAGDRKLGQYWEEQFGHMAAARGKLFTGHQWKKSQSALAYKRGGKVVLPDITIWSRPGEHHEIKHKNPTNDEYFGLERYRLESLVEFAKAAFGETLYTIHDWTTPGRDNRENNIDHWITAPVLLLSAHVERETDGYSYINAEKKLVPICYWKIEWFGPLADYWAHLQHERLL